MSKQKIRPAQPAKWSAELVDIYPVSAVLEKIERLTAALRAAGMDVKIEANVTVNFEVQIDKKEPTVTARVSQ
jgi:hypothetical protein